MGFPGEVCARAERVDRLLDKRIREMPRAVSSSGKTIGYNAIQCGRKKLQKTREDSSCGIFDLRYTIYERMVVSAKEGICAGTDFQLGLDPTFSFTD